MGVGCKKIGGSGLVVFAAGLFINMAGRVATRCSFEYSRRFVRWVPLARNPTLIEPRAHTKRIGAEGPGDGAKVVRIAAAFAGPKTQRKVVDKKNMPFMEVLRVSAQTFDSPN